MSLRDIISLFVLELHMHTNVINFYTRLVKEEEQEVVTQAREDSIEEI